MNAHILSFLSEKNLLPLVYNGMFHCQLGRPGDSIKFFEISDTFSHTATKHSLLCKINVF